MRLLVHRDAEAEVEDAAIWYEARRAGLGLEFMAAIDRAFADIVQAPQRFARWKPRLSWRRHVLRRFPYVVFFDGDEDCVLIMAVAHGRRRPGYWVSRRPPLRHCVLSTRCLQIH